MATNPRTTTRERRKEGRGLIEIRAFCDESEEAANDAVATLRYNTPSENYLDLSRIFQELSIQKFREIFRIP